MIVREAVLGDGLMIHRDVERILDILYVDRVGHGHIVVEQRIASKYHHEKWLLAGLMNLEFSQFYSLSFSDIVRCSIQYLVTVRACYVCRNLVLIRKPETCPALLRCHTRWYQNMIRHDVDFF